MITLSGYTNEHFVIRRSVNFFNASKRGVPTPDSEAKKSIAFPLRPSPPLARKALINFAWFSLLSLIGTLTTVFERFPPVEDRGLPFLHLFLGPLTEQGREPIEFTGSELNGFVDAGRLTIFSSNTKQKILQVIFTRQIEIFYKDLLITSYYLKIL